MHDQGNCGICENSLHNSIAILQKPTVDSLQKLTNTLHTFRSCFFKSVTILSSHPVIKDDSGGICNTLGNDSMCDSKQKSTYEHGSDFGRLPRYGKKKIRTILRARTAIT